jgi:hypothetical protein
MKIKFYFYGSNNKNKYNSYLHNYKKLNAKIVKKNWHIICKDINKGYLKKFSKIMSNKQEDVKE